MARHHVVPLIGHPESYLSSIHMADGGTAVAAALQLPAGTYNVVDDEPLTKREYAQALAFAAGKRPSVRGPGRLAFLLGHRMASLTRSMRVSNRRFREASGWQPRYPSAREGWIAGEGNSGLKPELELDAVGVLERHEPPEVEHAHGGWATPSSSKWAIQRSSSLSSRILKAK